MNKSPTIDAHAEERTALGDSLERLYPLLRSITGEGVRQSHDILGEILPLERIEVPSGTEVFDWVVPPEWVVREAYVIDPSGKRILDVAEHNLHLVNYSAPFRGRIDRAALDEHLHSLPEQPDAIPYVTSYYNRRWGFCLPHAMREALLDGEYQVVIDTNFLANGSLTISEAVLPGEEPEEVLISTYTCHPSMANHELSGPLVAAFLHRRLAAWPERRLTYRFVFLPETIGAIAYLSMRGEHLRQRLVAGYVVTCVGLGEGFTYQRSKAGDTAADRCAIHVLEAGDEPFEVHDFAPVGSDERQYCSPGFDLPVGSLMRIPYGRFPEYHTSLDDLSLVSPEALQGSVDAYEAVCRNLDMDAVYRNLRPMGEPNLGNWGLYPTMGGKRANMDHRRRAHATLWLVNQCDGATSLLTIAKRSNFPLVLLDDIARRCQSAGLFERVTPGGNQ